MIVGLTGGIGSGKSTVASVFVELGIPVFIADTEGKRLMRESSEVKNAIVSAFGKEAYIEDNPNRKYLADLVFNDPKKLEQLNAIIHPAVGVSFKKWYQEQEAPYVVKEAAVLFESGADKDCDVIIIVTAPLETRIHRVVERDQTTREAVMERIENQWSEEEKIKRADFVIENIDMETTRLTTTEIHEQLLKKSI
ncbi:dephospho-CoA kinase [Galbibacter sp. EGI 63066]|uniref:dephospho-CoA kinase n=1 Tax=Galbibacter sp. EGI 63066 TaxID=2993559 RepID=UPI0022498594|nr:dephospho-CoA kinase [Galbibacter sp. EGI 63066]MCX2681690.1 dephospho-CoA kinase [Galbibacter sp. EGI 63066]